MTDLLALADRIAAETGPSRELDLAIWQALRGPEWRWWSYPNTVGIDLRTISALPNYTSSLDAIAAAIRERGFQYATGYVEEDGDKPGHFGGVFRSLEGTDSRDAVQNRPNAALALCEALIRAMAGEASND